jgi:hypothetical protein
LALLDNLKTGIEVGQNILRKYESAYVEFLHPHGVEEQPQEFMSILLSELQLE